MMALVSLNTAAKPEAAVPGAISLTVEPVAGYQPTSSPATEQTLPAESDGAKHNLATVIVRIENRKRSVGRNELRREPCEVLSAL